MNGTAPRHGERGSHQRQGEAPGADRIEVRHNGGETYAAGVLDHKVIVDQPVPAGGDAPGPTPVELFVTALATCVAYYAGSFLKRHGLAREGLRVFAEFDMAKGLRHEYGPYKFASFRPTSSAQLSTVRGATGHDEPLHCGQLPALAAGGQRRR
ncbi:OsmC family protein [Streptomyces sp. CB02923]|uniref:OsmC family protein n=1 Tax=Streptomyces sp. CB02923 TaxID=1718985 RepID=UPI003FD149D5